VSSPKLYYCKQEAHSSAL